MQSWKFLIEYLISKYLILYIESFLDNFFSRNYTFEINYIIYKENYKKIYVLSNKFGMKFKNSNVEIKVCDFSCRSNFYFWQLFFSLNF